MTESITRHSFKIADAIDALLPDGMADCGGAEIRVTGDLVVIDIIAPTVLDNPATQAEIKEDGAKKPPKDTASEPEQQKGGKRAQRAGILCNEGGFQRFLDVAGPDAAKETIYSICGIESRRDLDHNESAAKEFDNLISEYNEWLNPPF